MSELSSIDFYNIMSRSDFNERVDIMLSHQQLHTGEPEHQDCVGLYYTKPERNRIEASVIMYNHRSSEPERYFGHIAPEVWGNVGLYATVRDDISPTAADIEALNQLHTDNVYAVRGMITSYAFGINYLFLRHQRRGGFDPNALRSWEDRLPLAEKFSMLAAAGVNCSVKGLITTNIGLAFHTHDQLFN